MFALKKKTKRPGCAIEGVPGEIFFTESHVGGSVAISTAV